MKDTIRQSEAIRNAWVDAVSDSVVNFRMQDGQKKNAQEGVRYSLRGTTDGRTVAVVDEDILSNIDLTQWNKQTKKEVQAAAKEALKKFGNGIVVDGITRSVNKVSRNEYTGSKYSEKISKTMPQLYADKMRAASAIDDVVIATTDWARDGKLLHPRTDNFVDFDHGNVLIEAGKNQYAAEVVVGITDRGNAVFYDVVDIQPTQFTIIKEEPSPKGANGICSYDGSLPTEISGVFGEESYRNGVAGAYKNKYYISMDGSGTQVLFVYDTAKGIWHKETGGAFTSFCQCRGELYAILGGEILAMTGSTGTQEGKLRWKLETGLIGCVSPDAKYLARLNLRVRMDSGCDMNIYSILEKHLKL